MESISAGESVFVMATFLVCKPVPTLQTLLERSGAYCISEADAAADSAARSEFRCETEMPADSATFT